MPYSKHRQLAPVFALVAVCLVGATAVAVAAAQPFSDSQVDRLRATELDRLRALVDADMAAIEPLTADDFRLVPPPGMPLSRAEYVGAVAAGAIDYLAFEPISEMDVRLYGQAAAMQYLARIDVVVAGLGHFAQDVWVTLLYEKRQGRWQAVWEQATWVGGFPLPPG